MDPASAFGIASGAFQVVQCIGHVLKGLKELAEKFQNADLTIRSLMLELFTIKAAIIQLDDWATYNSGTSSRNRDYDRDLRVALEGCRAIMEILWEEVLSLTRNVGSEGSTTMGFMTRAKVVWDEDLMKSRQEMLHSQVLALQLLLQVCHCRSSSEQTELLQNAENRRIMKKVVDDTITIRSHKSSAASRADGSSSRHARSSIGDTVFEFDDSVVNSVPYRRAKEHFRSIPERINHNSDDSNIYTDKDCDSGDLRENIPSLSTSVQPYAVQINPPPPSPVSPHDLVVPTPNHSKSVSFGRDSSQSGQDFRRWQSTPSSGAFLSSGSRRERFRSSLRRFSIYNLDSLKKQPPDVSGTSSSPLPKRESTRGRRGDFNVSIDLMSPEEAVSVPAIVKTAQIGSRFDVERLIESGHGIETRHAPSRRNALLVAAHCGNADVVDLLIQNNATLNVVDKSGSTALHLAASRGHSNVLELLLLENMDIETVDLHGRTPFRVAADNGQLESTRLLLLSYANVNTRTSNQMTALHVAARRGDEEMVELLISQRADMEAKDGAVMTALHYACENAHLGVIKLLVNHKADIDAAGCDRRTPLICAAAMGKGLISQFLLDKKASSLRTDDGGMTALHWAAFNGHVEVVDLLSRKKDSLRMTNTVGRVPLHLAVMNSQYGVVDFILRKMTSVDIRCSSGLTPLHYACTADLTGIARLLLMSGSDIEAQTTEDLQRPIHLAAARNSMKLLDLLCDKGASLDARDSLGDRALCTACRYGHAGAVQLLLDRGSPLHLRFGVGQRYDSPLCLAAKDGHLPVVSLLLHRGASVLVKDDVGWQAIHYAAFYGHPEILQHLLSSVPASTNGGSRVNLSAEHIGFAPNIYISEERKEEVRRILNREYGEAPRVNRRGLIHENVFTTAATSNDNSSPTLHASTTLLQNAAQPYPLETISELPSLVPVSRPPTPPTNQDALSDISSMKQGDDVPVSVPSNNTSSSPLPPSIDQRLMLPDWQRLIRTSLWQEPPPSSRAKVQAWHQPQPNQMEEVSGPAAVNAELAANLTPLQPSSTPPNQANKTREPNVSDMETASITSSVYTAPEGTSPEEIGKLDSGTAHGTSA